MSACREFRKRNGKGHNPEFVMHFVMGYFVFVGKKKCELRQQMRYYEFGERIRFRNILRAALSHGSVHWPNLDKLQRCCFL